MRSASRSTPKRSQTTAGRPTKYANSSECWPPLWNSGRAMRFGLASGAAVPSASVPVVTRASRISDSRVPPWVTLTAFGRPVVPPVNRMHASASGPTSTPVTRTSRRHGNAGTPASAAATDAHRHPGAAGTASSGGAGAGGNGGGDVIPVGGPGGGGPGGVLRGEEPGDHIGPAVVDQQQPGRGLRHRLGQLGGVVEAADGDRHRADLPGPEEQEHDLRTVGQIAGDPVAGADAFGPQRGGDAPGEQVDLVERPGPAVLAVQAGQVAPVRAPSLQDGGQVAGAHRVTPARSPGRRAWG